MTLPLTLPTEALENPAMDYAFLRSEGIRILERLSGQLWTDFNIHDPGITILEQLCYAITDLAYRANYDIKDLLASGDEDPYRSLHTPAQVLTTHPVTLTDLRKLVIDVPGVKNGWFEPIENAEPGLMYDASEDSLYLKTPLPQPPHRTPVSMRGIYRVLLEADSSLEFHAANILPEVNRRLHACRGLAEDFISPIILPGQGILVNATIEIGAVDDPEQLLARIYYALSRSISPRIHFYTLTEMLKRGKNIDEIMDGPALEHGFIDDVELEQLERKIGLRTSDLIQEILNVEGTVTVGSINLSDGIRTEDWYLKLDPSSTPFLDVDQLLFNEKGATIRLVRGGIDVQPKPERVAEIVKRLQRGESRGPLPETQRDIRLSVGRDRNTSQYHSIQHQFPATYGIGTTGLPDSAAEQRKAQAKQLKAYLLFFDQLLANYFAQLGHAKDLFSFYTQQSRTYFSQIIDDASLGLEAIRGDDLAAHAARVQEITELSALEAQTMNPDDPAVAERKNRFLNHLLARFAEQFTDYSLLLYAHLSEDDLIKNKSAFLQDYQEIGVSRGSGFNYSLPTWGSENISGLEKRISRKLGISTYLKRDLAEAGNDDEGGFHMLEHLLLRPGAADKEQWAQATAGTGWQAAAFIAQPMSNNPYSQQVSFIFPDWITRFADKGFSDLIEKTLREETPAQIRVHLHWLNRDEMLAFESAYRTWLENVILSRLWETVEIQSDDDLNHLIRVRMRDARDRMAQILGIGTPYPLRDLKLVYPALVAYKHPAAIQIIGGQAGVLYQLCDEDGNPVIENDKGFEIQPEAGVADDQIFLPTPAIIKDITFTVLAIRENKSENLRLETYLNQTVSIKVGIDKELPVVFNPAPGQIVNGDTRITINYGDKVTATVYNTQEGISYKLIMGPVDAPVNLSSAQKGNQSSITLVSKQGFNEDTQIYILAYRTANSKISAPLNAILTILVRPNPAVLINVAPSIVDYKTASTLTLAAPQSGVEYRLFKRELVAAEYLTSATGNLVVPTEGGRNVFIQAPGKITNWDTPDNFVPVGTFAESNGQLSVSTGSLAEDALFIVQATKTESGVPQQLDQAVVVLTRPDPTPVVSVQKGVVESGQSGVVTLKNTQKGVFYQLRLDENNQAVNPPGYYLTDRGIETVRLEFDLVVESQGSPILLLPTSAISKATTFNILATKLLTGISAQLTGKATLDIPAPTAGT